MSHIENKSLAGNDCILESRGTMSYSGQVGISLKIRGSTIEVGRMITNSNTDGTECCPEKYISKKNEQNNNFISDIFFTNPPFISD